MQVHRPEPQQASGRLGQPNSIHLPARLWQAHYAEWDGEPSLRALVVPKNLDGGRRQMTGEGHPEAPLTPEEHEGLSNSL